MSKDSALLEPHLEKRMAAGNKGRVLVVDDEMDVRKSVRSILSKAGYDVDEAEDPEAGVAMVKWGANPLPLNAIISGLDMPTINETIVIPYFRSKFPSCPVIALSRSHGQERLARLFKKLGVEFLPKPIDRERLLGAMDRVVTEGVSKDNVVA
jgi:DNA-binding NtrC family response regulator